MSDEIVARVARYYTRRIEEYGPTHAGVDWNSAESQLVRFQQLLRLCQGAEHFSLNDYGCGYGALVDLLLREHRDFTYVGYDVSPVMIEHARNRHPGVASALFTADDADLHLADYTVASGIFNVKAGAADREWRDYVLATVERLAALSRRGFAFNVLSAYSDPDRMRDDLFYADPCWLFDHVMRTYSRQSSLLHDYGLFESTMLVRLD